MVRYLMLCFQYPSRCDSSLMCVSPRVLVCTSGCGCGDHAWVPGMHAWIWCAPVSVLARRDLRNTQKHDHPWGSSEAQFHQGHAPLDIVHRCGVCGRQTILNRSIGGTWPCRHHASLQHVHIAPVTPDCVRALIPQSECLLSLSVAGGGEHCGQGEMRLDSPTRTSPYTDNRHV
jgi:hypothetical protein